MKSACNRAKQGGAALLLLMLALVLAFSVAAWRYLSSDTLRNQKLERTTQALAIAKAALLARATLDSNRPGSLPCPDIDNDGTADATVPGGICERSADDAAAGEDSPYIGRFPYRTLEMDDLRDGNGERLWYVLPEKLSDANDNVINANISSGITFNADSQVIAIVFSAGPPLAGQTGRPSVLKNDYLEGSNAATDSSTFISGTSTESFNDIALAIRKDEWLNAIAPRVLQMIRGHDDPASPGEPIGGLRAYYRTPSGSPRLEFPATLPEAFSATCTVGNANDNVLICNQWPSVSGIYARDSSDFSKATLTLGRFVVNVTP